MSSVARVSPASVTQRERPDSAADSCRRTARIDAYCGAPESHVAVVSYLLRCSRGAQWLKERAGLRWAKPALTAELGRR